MKDNSWAGRGPPSPASANVWSDVSTEPGSQGTGSAGCVTPDKPHHVSETQLSHLQHGCYSGTHLMGCFEKGKEIKYLAHGSSFYPHPLKFTF